MFDISPYLWPEDPWLRIEPPGNVRASYAFKHTVGLLLQPQRILEIGVRAGYAAAAFLAACPHASYHGVDADNSQHGGLPGAVGWARTMLARHFPGRAIRIEAPVDTRQHGPDGSGYDLAHVDGDHGGRQTTTKHTKHTKRLQKWRNRGSECVDASRRTRLGFFRVFRVFRGDGSCL